MPEEVRSRLDGVHCGLDRMLCAWNSIKLILNGPVSVVLLLRARIREAVARRRARRPDYDQPHEYAEVHP